MKVVIDNQHLHVMVSDKLLTQLSSDTLKQTYPRYNWSPSCNWRWQRTLNLGFVFNSGSLIIRVRFCSWLNLGVLVQFVLAGFPSPYWHRLYHGNGVSQSGQRLRYIDVADGNSADVHCHSAVRDSVPGKTGLDMVASCNPKSPESKTTKAPKRHSENGQCRRSYDRIALYKFD